MIERILPSTAIGVRNRFRRLQHLSQAMLGHLIHVSRQATASHQSAATAPRTAPALTRQIIILQGSARLCAIERALAERARMLRQA